MRENENAAFKVGDEVKGIDERFHPGKTFVVRDVRLFSEREAIYIDRKGGEWQYSSFFELIRPAIQSANFVLSAE